MTVPGSLRGRRLPCVMFALASVVYVVSAAFHNGSGDVITSNLASWQLAGGHRPYLDRFSYPALDDHPRRYVWVVLDHHGREIIGRAGGPVLLAVPAYAFTTWVLGNDGFSQVPGAVTAALASGAAVALFTSTVRPRLGTKNTVLAALVLAFGTPVWTVAADATWPQTVTVLGICAMAWAASRDRWMLVGLAGGAAMWGRIQVVVIVALLGLVIGILRRNPQVVVRVAAASGAMLGALLAWNRWMYGSWSPTAYYNHDDLATYQPDGYVDIVNQLGSWVSLDRGILVWTPLLLVLLPNLVRRWRSVPDWSLVLACSGVAYTAFEAALIVFPGGDSFYGYRMTLELLVCLAPAATIAATDLGRLGRWLLAPLITLQVVAMSAGAFNDNLGLPAADAWRQNAFVTAAFRDPFVGVTVVVVSGLIAVVARRIWADPAIRTTDLSPASEPTPARRPDRS
jgi:hypothetical protein